MGQEAEVFSNSPTLKVLIQREIPRNTIKLKKIKKKKLTGTTKEWDA